MSKKTEGNVTTYKHVENFGTYSRVMAQSMGLAHACLYQDLKDLQAYYESKYADRILERDGVRYIYYTHTKCESRLGLSRKTQDRVLKDLIDNGFVLKLLQLNGRKPPMRYLHVITNPYDHFHQKKHAMSQMDNGVQDLPYESDEEDLDLDDNVSNHCPKGTLVSQQSDEEIDKFDFDEAKLEALLVQRLNELTQEELEANEREKKWNSPSLVPCNVPNGQRAMPQTDNPIVQNGQPLGPKGTTYNNIYQSGNNPRKKILSVRKPKPDQKTVRNLALRDEEISSLDQNAIPQIYVSSADHDERLCPRLEHSAHITTFDGTIQLMSNEYLLHILQLEMNWTYSAIEQTWEVLTNQRTPIRNWKRFAEETLRNILKKQNFAENLLTRSSQECYKGKYSSPESHVPIRKKAHRFAPPKNPPVPQQLRERSGYCHSENDSGTHVRYPGDPLEMASFLSWNVLTKEEVEHSFWLALQARGRPIPQHLWPLAPSECSHLCVHTTNAIS